jgi:hypothetical protein
VVKMPTISEFLGILILMFYDDHSPPHFHARYGEFEVMLQISPLEVINGKFPRKALSLVIEWAQAHQDELLENWNYAANNKKLSKIPPLE